MSWLLDHDACVRPAPHPHAWKAVYRLSTWDAQVTHHCSSCRLSGLLIRVRPVCPASILLAKDRVVEVAAGHFLNGHCLPTPLTRRLSQLAAVTAIHLGDPSGIAMTSLMASPALDASLGRPLPYLQVAVAAACQGHRVRQRWGHQGRPP